MGARPGRAAMHDGDGVIARSMRCVALTVISQGIQQFAGAVRSIAKLGDPLQLDLKTLQAGDAGLHVLQVFVRNVMRFVAMQFGMLG